MNLLAYGVIPTTTNIDSDAPYGVNGDPIRCAWGNALGLVYSTCPGESVADLAIRYASVIECLHHRGNLLPFRNGCIAIDEAELLAILEENEADYHALLDDFRDCEEMSLRIHWDESAKEVLGGSLPDLSTIPDDGEVSKSGMRSGMGRGARGPRRDPQTAQAEYVQLLCERFFTGLVKLTRTQWIAQPEISLLLQFLIERQKTPQFAKRFDQFNDVFAVRAEIAGPQPLYTFAITAPLGCQTLPESL